MPPKPATTISLSPSKIARLSRLCFERLNEAECLEELNDPGTLREDPDITRANDMLAACTKAARRRGDALETLFNGSASASAAAADPEDEYKQSAFVFRTFKKVIEEHLSQHTLKTTILFTNFNDFMEALQASEQRTAWYIHEWIYETIRYARTFHAIQQRVAKTHLDADGISRLFAPLLFNLINAAGNSFGLMDDRSFITNAIVDPEATFETTDPYIPTKRKVQFSNDTPSHRRSYADFRPAVPNSSSDPLLTELAQALNTRPEASRADSSTSFPGEERRRRSRSSSRRSSRRHLRASTNDIDRRAPAPTDAPEEPEAITTLTASTPAERFARALGLFNTMAADAEQREQDQPGRPRR